MSGAVRRSGPGAVSASASRQASVSAVAAAQQPAPIIRTMPENPLALLKELTQQIKVCGGVGRWRRTPGVGLLMYVGCCISLPVSIVLDDYRMVM